MTVIQTDNILNLTAIKTKLKLNNLLTSQITYLHLILLTNRELGRENLNTCNNNAKPEKKNNFFIADISRK